VRLCDLKGAYSLVPVEVDDSEYLSEPSVRPVELRLLIVCRVATRSRPFKGAGGTRPRMQVNFSGQASGTVVCKPLFLVGGFRVRPKAMTPSRIGPTNRISRVPFRRSKTITTSMPCSIGGFVDIDPMSCALRTSIRDDQSIKAHGTIQTHGLSPSLEFLGNSIIRHLLILHPCIFPPLAPYEGGHLSVLAWEGRVPMWTVTPFDPLYRAMSRAMAMNQCAAS